MQVLVPEIYVRRLKVIHAVATKRIYGAEAVITTTETPEGKFETFMTIGKVTRKYCEVPLRTAATIETIAIYQSLRYITNVLGYRIIDLNYPTLSKLMSDLNKQSTHMTLLQCCVSNAEEHVEQLYEGFPSLDEDFTAAAYNLDNIGHLRQSMQHLQIMIQNYRTDIFRLCNEFTEAKVLHAYHLVFPFQEHCSPAFDPKKILFSYTGEVLLRAC